MSYFGAGRLAAKHRPRKGERLAAKRVNSTMGKGARFVEWAWQRIRAEGHRRGHRAARRLAGARWFGVRGRGNG